MAVTPALPDTDAGRRNMSLLIQLRWIAVGGQLATIGLVHGLMGIRLSLPVLLIAPALLVAFNFASLLLVRHRREVTNSELTAALLLDVAALAWLLYWTGGSTNPFTSLFLLQVVMGAVLLRPATSWLLMGAALVALGWLSIDSRPLALPPAYRDDVFGLYLLGSFVSLTLIAVLLVAFVTRISRNLRDRDASLAAIRQRAIEEDHIVRIGLLASGAAHELGTPLSSLSVLIGDWKSMPRLAGDRELQEDLADMDAAVRRCKTIVSGILNSAGEARGIAPQVTTMRGFLNAIVTEWSASRLPGAVHYEDRFGEDIAIVSDPALRQVIANVVDNAGEVSPNWVGITAAREEDALILEIADRGPGFSQEMLESFGKPYRSTKGKPGGGLGIFLLVNVLRKLGGTASAANREEGGAVVRIRLPLSALAYRKETQR
ncbi:ATP-binding protein [Sphingomonas sp. HF-S3]|uniref:histidine kinase n=1 Tax=Sphingomonas rustica TaxID=3103142 RepID=A0ABV0B4X1_9SPHN